MIRQLRFISTLLLLFFTSFNLFSSGSEDFTETGMASWYGGKFQGRQTANGEIFDTNLMTAAHKSLPFGTMVKVVNLDNETETVVRINDRGPFVQGRIIDLSRAAADKLNMVGSGVARVRISIVSGPSTREITHKSTPESGTVIIQAGAYSNRENADNLRTQLLEHGFRAEFEYAGNITRVIIKNVPSEGVESALDRLSAMGITSPLVRRSK